MTEKKSLFTKFNQLAIKYRGMEMGAAVTVASGWVTNHVVDAVMMGQSIEAIVMGSLAAIGLAVGLKMINKSLDKAATEETVYVKGDDVSIEPVEGYTAYTVNSSQKEFLQENIKAVNLYRNKFDQAGDPAERAGLQKSLDLHMRYRRDILTTDNVRPEGSHPAPARGALSPS